MSKSNKPFTFNVTNGEVPKVTIDGQKFHVVTCSYSWWTDTCNHNASPVAVVCGYLEGELKVKIIKFVFKTNEMFVLG